MVQFIYLMETFTDWLESEIKARGWRPADLAQQAGITDATLSRILSGSRQAGVDVCLAIARAFKLPKEEVFRRRGWLDPITPKEQEEEEVLNLFRQLGPHDQMAALKVLRGLAEYPSPEPLEMIMMREIPQLDALRQAIALWGQGKEIEAFWPLAAVLSSEMQEKVEAFLLEIKEAESQEKTPNLEGGN